MRSPSESVRNKKNKTYHKLASLLTCILFGATICTFGYQQIYAIERPHGIAIDSTGNIYTSESGNSVEKLDSNGQILTTWGVKGDGEGEFNDPHGVAIDGSGNIYVVDTANFRVQKFSPDGSFILSIGSEGRNDGQFIHPHAVAVDDSENVYVGDYLIPKIQKFDSNGNFISKWGTEGQGPSQFRVEREGEGVGPEGIDTDKSSNVYIADPGNARVQKFDNDGNFITMWGSNGTGKGHFIYPSGLTVDPSGNIFVSDEVNKNIQKFDSNGNFITMWGSPEIFGHVHYIATDPAGNVFVTDLENGNIQKFDNNGNALAEFRLKKLMNPKVNKSRIK